MTEEKGQTYVKTIKNLDSRTAKSGEDYYEATYTDDTKDRFWRDHMPIVESAKRVGSSVKVGRAKKDGYWNVTSVEITQDKPPIEQQTSQGDTSYRQTAVKAVVDLAVGGVLPKDHPLVLRTLEWCAEKLGVDLHNVSKSSQERQGTAQEVELVKLYTGESRILKNWDVFVKSVKQLKWESGLRDFIYRSFDVHVEGDLKEIISRLTLEQQDKIGIEIKDRMTQLEK